VTPFPTSPEPFRIDPVFSPRIWGVRSLAPLFPEKTNLAEPLGEAWLTGLDCKIATGPFAGKTLGAAWPEMPAEWRGTKLASTPNFPILVKFIFPADKLSIQVHPDDAYASIHEKAAGGRGKTEMWHVISAEPGAQLLAGLKSGVTKEKFLEALVNHTFEDVFESHEVHAGETFFIPAGTPHTIGPKMVICEVQEYSDLTYRIYDYGRVDAQGKPRELHIEKALEVIRFGAPAVLPFHRSHPMDEIESAYVEYLAACRYFAVEKWDFDGWLGKRRTNAARFELLTILKGGGHIQWAAGESAYSAGETWLLPASLDEYELRCYPGGAEILRIYVPDLLEFEKMIADKGYSEEDRRRFIFT
jgi:mannose-6-phosphate isomerase